MNEYYELSLGFEHFGPVFAGAPDTSVWQVGSRRLGGVVAGL